MGLERLFTCNTYERRLQNIQEDEKEVQSLELLYFFCGFLLFSLYMLITAKSDHIKCVYFAGDNR